MVLVSTKLDSMKGRAMENTDTLLVAMENRAFLYSFVWRLFAAPIDADALALAASEEPIEQAILLAGENTKLIDLAKRLAQAAAEADFDALSTEYTRLFEGPTKLPAPPWESVYKADGDLLFQESTLHVREAYKEAGFQAAGYPHEADDHLATELSFMSALIQGTKDAIEADDATRANAFLIAQHKFLDQHLNLWLTPFAERLNTQAPSTTSPFYPTSAYFAAELCACDTAAVADLLTLVR